MLAHREFHVRGGIRDRWYKVCVTAVTFGVRCGWARMSKTNKAVFALTGCLLGISAAAQQVMQRPDPDAITTHALQSFDFYAPYSPRYIVAGQYGWLGMPGLHTSVYDLDYWLTSPVLAPVAVTIAYSWRNLRFEGAVSREQESVRKHLEFDSTAHGPFAIRAGTLSYRPAADWLLQLSRGQFNRPEQFDPNDEIRRTTMSATYRRPIRGNDFQTILAFGRSARKANGSTTNAVLLETSMRIDQAHTVFGRVERAAGDELFHERDALRGEVFNASKLTLGYVYEVAQSRAIKLGIGGVASKYILPDTVPALLNGGRMAYQVFARLVVQVP